jgi:hypothetical protein
MGRICRSHRSSKCLTMQLKFPVQPRGKCLCLSTAGVQLMMRGTANEPIYYPLKEDRQRALNERPPRHLSWFVGRE